MSKHFRVIEGGKSPTKDGLNEVPGQAIMAELRHIDGSGPRPRYARPELKSRSFAHRPVSGRYWHKPEKFDFGFILLMLTVPLAGFWMVWKVSAPDAMPVPSAITDTTDTESASFGMCHAGGGYNCVVDGDTFYYKGTKIRIADIDTPETHPQRCAYEAKQGAAATRRLRELVNAGTFSLTSIERDQDRYGRKLRVVTRGGESLGGVLVEEGLARWYGGGRQAWC